MVRAKQVVSWVIVLWIAYIFLGSLPYKFTQAPDTQHIFGTIGEWIGSWAGATLGNLFSSIGAYVVGSFEALTTLVLLIPVFVWLSGKRGMVWENVRRHWHRIGGLMASAVMVGAVFFHLFTPLGIEVLHNGQPDGGSLFKAAVSILILGVVLFVINLGQAE